MKVTHGSLNLSLQSPRRKLVHGLRDLALELPVDHSYYKQYEINAMRL